MIDDKNNNMPIQIVAQDGGISGINFSLTNYICACVRTYLKLPYTIIYCS